MIDERRENLSKQAIYVASMDELAGKSAITISLSLKAKELGKKVGYFKPIGLGSAISPTGEVVDEDVQTMKEILKLESETELICPIILGKGEFLEGFDRSEVSKYADKIVALYEKASEDKDVMLIEGPPSLSIGSFLGSPVPKLAADFDARLLLVARVRDDFVVDELLQARDCCVKWGVSPFGVILNRVPADRTVKVKRVIKSFLEGNGLGVLGVIPENKVLSSLSVGEVYASIGGRILAGKRGMDKMIQTFLIGAMTMEGAVRYFRKATNKLVITGGDRTDVIFAALETGTSALILTGNLYPSVKIFPRADDLDVPVILVPYDTYTTLQLIQRIVGRIKPGDKIRIETAKKLFEKNVDWKKILS